MPCRQELTALVAFAAVVQWTLALPPEFSWAEGDTLSELSSAVGLSVDEMSGESGEQDLSEGDNVMHAFDPLNAAYYTSASAEVEEQPRKPAPSPAPTGSTKSVVTNPQNEDQLNPKLQRLAFGAPRPSPADAPGATEEQKSTALAAYGVVAMQPTAEPQPAPAPQQSRAQAPASAKEPNKEEKVKDEATLKRFAFGTPQARAEDRSKTAAPDAPQPEAAQAPRASSWSEQSQSRQQRLQERMRKRQEASAEEAKDFPVEEASKPNPKQRAISERERRLKARLESPDDVTRSHKNEDESKPKLGSLPAEVAKWHENEDLSNAKLKSLAYGSPRPMPAEIAQKTPGLLSMSMLPNRSTVIAEAVQRLDGRAITAIACGAAGIMGALAVNPEWLGGLSEGARTMVEPLKIALENFIFDLQDLGVRACDSGAAIANPHRLKLAFDNFGVAIANPHRLRLAFDNFVSNLQDIKTRAGERDAAEADAQGLDADRLEWLKVGLENILLDLEEIGVRVSESPGWVVAYGRDQLASAGRGIASANREMAFAGRLKLASVAQKLASVGRDSWLVMAADHLLLNMAELRIRAAIVSEGITSAGNRLASPLRKLRDRVSESTRTLEWKLVRMEDCACDAFDRANENLLEPAARRIKNTAHWLSVCACAALDETEDRMAEPLTKVMRIVADKAEAMAMAAEGLAHEADAIAVAAQERFASALNGLDDSWLKVNAENLALDLEDVGVRASRWLQECMCGALDRAEEKWLEAMMEGRHRIGICACAARDETLEWLEPAVFAVEDMVDTMRAKLQRAAASAAIRLDRSPSMDVEVGGRKSHYLGALMMLGLVLFSWLLSAEMRTSVQVAAAQRRGKKSVVAVVPQEEDEESSIPRDVIDAMVPDRMGESRREVVSKRDSPARRESQNSEAHRVQPDVRSSSSQTNISGDVRPAEVPSRETSPQPFFSNMSKEKSFDVEGIYDSLAAEYLRGVRAGISDDKGFVKKRVQQLNPNSP